MIAKFVQHVIILQVFFFLSEEKKPALAKTGIQQSMTRMRFSLYFHQHSCKILLLASEFYLETSSDELHFGLIV